MESRHHQDLVEKAKGLKPIRTAVVHPVDTVSLLGAIKAAEAGLIEPVLVGPQARIAEVAAQARLDLSRYELVATEHSHASAVQAVALAMERKVEALMKGSLHTEADILVVPDVEAGNMLAKQLEYLAKAEVAGIVLGARTPIILTSRADKTLARLSSCAIALLQARRTRKILP
jgi:phosphate acetyltransferase/phosphate butyryltransferase